MFFVKELWDTHRYRSVSRRRQCEFMFRLLSQLLFSASVSHRRANIFSASSRRRGFRSGSRETCSGPREDKSATEYTRLLSFITGLQTSGARIYSICLTKWGWSKIADSLTYVRPSCFRYFPLFIALR